MAYHPPLLKKSTYVEVVAESIDISHVPKYFALKWKEKEEEMKGVAQALAEDEEACTLRPSSEICHHNLQIMSLQEEEEGGEGAEEDPVIALATLMFCMYYFCTGNFVLVSFSTGLSWQLTRPVFGEPFGGVRIGSSRQLPSPPSTTTSASKHF